MKKYNKNRPEKRLVIKVPPIRQKLSTFELIKRSFNVWLDKVSAKKGVAKDHSAGMPDLSSWSNISHFAIVIEDDVVDIMHVQPKMAAWLQSNPKFISFDANDNFLVAPGFKYIDGKFVDPNLNLDINPTMFNFGDKDEK